MFAQGENRVEHFHRHTAVLFFAGTYIKSAEILELKGDGANVLSSWTNGKHLRDPKSLLKMQPVAG